MMFEVISKVFFEGASFEAPRVAVLAERAEERRAFSKPEGAESPSRIFAAMVNE